MASVGECLLKFAIDVLIIAIFVIALTLILYHFDVPIPGWLNG